MSKLGRPKKETLSEPKNEKEYDDKTLEIFKHYSEGQETLNIVRKFVDKFVEEYKIKSGNSPSEDIRTNLIHELCICHALGQISHLNGEIIKLHGIIDIKDGKLEEAKKKWDDLDKEKERQKTKEKESRKYPEAYPKIKITFGGD